MELRFLTWPDVAEYLSNDNRLILPIGSVEQHGPKCVFGTDYLIAETLGKEVAERTNTIVAPSPSYGMSIHHLGFPGSATLQPSNMMRAYEDIIWSFKLAGFKRILIVNGHGGNIDTVNSMLSEISNKWRELKLKLKSWWDYEDITAYIKKAFGDREGQHGTPAETSMMMYLFPGVVREDRTVEFRADPGAKYFTNYIEFQRLYPNGLVGSDPNLATVEHGQHLFEACVTNLIKEMNEW